MVACLNEAMERQGLDMQVSALVCLIHDDGLLEELICLDKLTN